MAPCFSQGVVFEDLSWDDALSLAQSQEKIIFVELQTAWCSNCRKLERKTFSDESVGSLMNKNFVNLKYDAENGQGYELASFFKISAFPTMLFFDANGIVQMRLTGYKKVEAFKTVAQHVMTMKTDEELAELIQKLRVDKKQKSRDLELAREYYGSFYYPEWSRHINEMYSSWNSKQQLDSLNLSFLGDNYSILNDKLKWHVIQHSSIPNVFDDRRGEIIRRQRYIEEDLLASIEKSMDHSADHFRSRMKMYRAFRLNTEPNVSKDKLNNFIDSKYFKYFEKNKDYEGFAHFADSLVSKKVLSVSDEERMIKDYGSRDHYMLLSQDEKVDEISNPKRLRSATRSLLDYITPITQKYLDFFSDENRLQQVIDWSDHAIHLFPRSINYIHKVKALDKLGLTKQADQVILKALQHKHIDFGKQQFDHFVKHRNRN